MLEWLIPIIVDNICGYILDQSGLGEQVRNKFQHKPVQEAFQRSLQNTFTHFEKLYPQLAAEDLFRQSFQEPACASILAQLLIRDGQKYSSDLAKLWADALYKEEPTKRAASLRKLKPIAADFLHYLDTTLKTEPALREIHDSQALERTASGVAALSSDIRTLVSHYVPPQLSEEDFRKQCQQYCKQLYDQSKMLDFKGIQHADINRPVSIPLSEVFVLPDVLVGVPEYETLEREELQTDDISDITKIERRGSSQETGELSGTSKKGRRGSIQEDELEPFLLRERKSSKEQQIVLQREDLRLVLAKHERLIILGDPGSGKSTFLRYLMLTLAENTVTFSNEFPQSASDVQNMIPLYIPLSSYAESWLSHGVEERSLKDFLPKHLRYTYLDAFANIVQWQLEHGQLLILLDGLDEIPDASLRMQIVRQIEIFTQSYPQNRYVVTSRIVGYKDAPLAAEYQAYTLADFNEEQIRTFTKKWCPVYERWVNQVEDSQSLQNAATKEADKLFQATHLNEGVKRLAVNPLLLTILALIQRQGIELPSHRVELFDLCTTTLLETWIRAKRPVGVTQLGKNNLIKILRPLAFWMHEHPAIGAIPEEEIQEQIVRQLLDRRVARHEEEAQQIAEQFLLTVRGQTGILIERGKHRYGFLHQTFEEYFAALELVVNKRDREDSIKQHLHDPRWRVVILLAVGILGILQLDENGVTDLVENAILKARSPFENWLHRDILLAGLCLADDVGVSIACEDAIIEQMIYVYFTSPFDSIRTSFSKVFDNWRGTATARRAIPLALSLIKSSEKLPGNETSISINTTEFSDTFQFRKVINTYFQQLEQQNRESSILLIRLHIVIALSHLTNMTGMVATILDALTDADSDVRRAAARALGQIGNGQPEVAEALLKALSDADPIVQATAASALSVSPIDNLFISTCLEEMLFSYEQIVSKQFTTDYLVDSLLSSLQQLIGEE